MTEKEKLKKEAFEDFCNWFFYALLMVGLWVWFIWRMIKFIRG